MRCGISRANAAMVGIAAAIAFGAGAIVGASDRQPEMEAMDPEAMMQAMQEANRLTEHHAHFKDMVGTWDGRLTAQMPGGEPFESKGVMTNEMVMGGRFLQGSWDGEMMGTPFTGISLMGYSSIEGEHQGVWYDSTANQLWYSTGSCDEQGVITMNGKETDPMSGQTIDYKDVITMKDADQMSMVRTYVTPMGEMPGFTIEYTRR